MCPVMMTLMSTAVSAIGAMQGASAAAADAKANEQLTLQQAEARKQKAEYDTESAERKFRRVEGKQFANAASSGFSTMSFADIFEDSALESETEVAAIQWSADHDVAQLKTQASAHAARGKNAQTGGFLSAAGSIFGGLGKAYKSSGGSAYVSLTG